MTKLYRPNHVRIPSGKVKFYTVSAVLISIIGILISIVPFFGASAVVIGLLGFILSILSYRLRSKHSLKKGWSILGLLLSMIAFSIGFTNYLNHKNAVDLILGVPGAKSKLLIVPEDSPLREVVERSTGYTEDEINQRKLESSKRKLAETEINSDPEVVVHESTKARKTMHDNKTTGPLKSYYYSIVDQLRIRSEPATNSEVLGHLEFGEMVRWFGEKSDEMEKIMLAGAERNDYWYKVRPINNYERPGWVYGGALLNATSPSSDRLLDRSVMTYNFISSDSLQVLIGREVYGNFKYSGLMTCYLGELNKLVSHGKFFFNGFSAYNDGELEGYEDETLRGIMKDGELHGDFVCKIGQLESYIDLTVKYEEGVCVSYKMIENQEGDLAESKSNDPEDCSFYAIQRKLRYLN